MNTSTLRVKLFPGAQNLPLQVALRQGLFTAQGLEVDLLFAGNSVELRQDLADGTVDIVHTAVDNALAMHRSGVPVTVFMGGDGGMNELFVQPAVSGVTDLAGRKVIVDAPDTAYGLQLRGILLGCGLHAGIDYELIPQGGTYQREAAMTADATYAGAMLNPPFSIRGRARGLRSLGYATDFLGKYLATAGFALREWHANNCDRLERYIVAYVQALRWIREPGNHPACIQMLEHDLQIDSQTARATFARLTQHGDGLAHDAQFDHDGFANVMSLRQRIDPQLASGLPSAAEIVDLTCHRNALGRLVSTSLH